MITCERTRALLSLYVLGDLKSDAATAAAAHLAACADCRQEYERIEATVALLQDALAETRATSPRLTAERRRQILATQPAGRAARRPVVRKRELWLVRHHHGLAVAAGLLVVFGLLWSVLLGNFGGHAEYARLSATRPRETADAIALEMSELDHSAAPVTLDNDDTDNRDVDDDGPDATVDPVDTDFTPAPAAFDELAAVKSPVIMRRIYGSRAPGARGGAGHDQKASRGKSKDLIVVSDLDESKVAADDKLGVNRIRIADAQAQPVDAPPLGRDPVFGDLPVVGRLSHGEPGHVLDGVGFVDTVPVGQEVAGESMLKQAAPPLSQHKPDAPATGPVAFYRPLPASGERDVGREVSEMTAGSGDKWKEDTESGADLGLTIVAAKRERPIHGAARGYGDEDGQVLSPANRPLTRFKGEAQLVVSPPAEERRDERFTEAAPRAEDAKKLTLALAELPAEVGNDRSEETTTEPPPPSPISSRPMPGEKDEIDEVHERPRMQAYGANPFKQTAVDPLSTFAIDVDTASYTIARTYMQRGNLPPAELVRTEEFVNAFDYAYRAPTRETFRIYTAMAPSPFGPGLHLLKIGVKGRRLGREEERPAVLTLVIDTSGSMNQPDRLELVQAAVHLLVEQLSPRDRVAVIQYDSHARIALEHTPAARKADILGVIDGLQCRGSTNLEDAMHQAYALAVRAFVPGAENRVILMSDGVANMGTDSAEAILRKVEANRRQGITCSVMGFGIGSYDDAMLESLANKGDGVYSFIDSLDQARRVFVDDLAATLNTIARDVKIQVRFNPATVARYRQLGYENRQLAHRDFRNDAIDAGEVGSGQSVTALYECALPPAVQAQVDRTGADEPIATVFVRYRRVDTGAVEEIEHPLLRRDVHADFRELPAEFRLAAGVAEFAEILRGSPFARGSDFEAVAGLLRPVALELHLDTRVQELLRLVHGAGSLAAPQ